jgi:lysozyme
MQTLGIDVSRWQGDINWFAVGASQVRFAFVKATEGSSSVDRKFAENWRAAREVGLFRGAYHFARPGGDPETQAAHFAATVGEQDVRDLPPVLDLEETDGHGPRHVLQWAEAFLRKAESLFRRQLILYTGGFWRFQLGNPDVPFFRQRKLWLAAYSQKPVVPASWQDWTFWQFSDGTHNHPVPIPGLSGPVDQNHFRGNEQELAALCDPGAGDRSGVMASTLPGNPELWPGVHFTWPHTPPISGDAVQLFQTRLSALGFPVKADGIYGPLTRAGCIAFQRDRGLKADGIVGPQTWDACVRN